MKKILCVILAALMLISLAACSSGPKTKVADASVLPEFSVPVNDKVITNETMAEYRVYSITVTTVNSQGTETTYTYVGYKLSDIIAAAGITEYITVQATANDGYMLDYTVAIEDSTTIVAFLRNDEPGVWVAPCSSKTSGDYLKNVESITTDGYVPKEDTSAPTGGLPEIQDKTDKVEFGAFNFLLNGEEVTNETLAGLSIYKITVTVTNSKGNTSEVTYTGYKLADVLDACGVTYFDRVIAVANDGYESKIDKETALSEYTLLAIEKDKETGEEGTVWVAPCESTTSGDYVKLVVEIKAL